MNDSRPVDLPLEVLLRTAHASFPELSDELVIKCYEIQRVRQFDRDDDTRYELTEALIEREIADQPGDVI